MFNIKWGGVSAGAAFAVALLISLIFGQTGLTVALLRAVVFAALFFGLGLATWSLINSFIPDLLSPSPEGGDIASKLFATGAAGTRVNITVDDTQNAALPEGGGDVGNFNELFTPKEDIDQIPAASYTEEGEEGVFAPIADDGFTSAFADDDLDTSLSGEGDEDSGEFSMDFSAFVPGGLDEGDGDGDAAGGAETSADMDSFSFFPEAGGSGIFDEPAVPERKVARNKPKQLEGDFNAKEIAAGLRTVLEKDKKG